MTKALSAQPAVLFLHGFLSSPASSKAQQLRHWLAERGTPYWCPQLSICPHEAIEQAEAAVDEMLDRDHSPRIIGSSLGGFYARFLMETHPARSQFRCGLLNPSCTPASDLAGQVGTHKAWHSDDQLTFKTEYLEDLRAMERPLTEPGRYFLIAATGDELLSWQQMVDFHPGAVHHIVQGSDHGLSDFAQHWPALSEFLFSD
jgi:predicted esterase YcpF (UPF0227 family)